MHMTDTEKGAAHRAWSNQTVEAALEPDLPICDAHHHLWLDTGHTGWPYTLADLHADTGAGHNVVRTVFLECGAEYRTDGPKHLRCVGETEFVAAQAEAAAGSGRAEIAAIMSSADLALGDVQGGVLETGDLGHLDDDGYLFIDGRLKRFGKVFGVRLNLDDIEGIVGGTVAAVAGDDQVIVFVEGAAGQDLQPRVVELADRLKLHWSGFEMRAVDALPLLSNGKVDYRTLESAR